MNDDGWIQSSLLFPLRPSLRDAFRSFHRDQPEVYRRLVDLARRAAAKGKRVGVRALWEKLRWDTEVGDPDRRDGFKLNDHHAPYYSRLMMRDEPDLAGFFEIRRIREEL